MFGGVAQRYILWKMVGEPYKKGKGLYVKMEHPVTKLPTEVRWYTDKAHADLMPKRGEADVSFPGKTFGFADKGDHIVAFRKRDLTTAEEEQYFNFCWKRGAKWRFGMFFGGIWYAPKDEPVPPVMRAGKVMKITWPEFVKAGQAVSEQTSGKKDGWWFKMEV